MSAIALTRASSGDIASFHEFLPPLLPLPRAASTATMAMLHDGQARYSSLLSSASRYHSPYAPVETLPHDDRAVGRCRLIAPAATAMVDAVAR